MIDVQVGIGLTTGAQVVDEPHESVALGRQVVGPEPVERRGAVVRARSLDPAEEVVEAHGRRLVVAGQPGRLPQRVALEVEEDVAGARRRQPVDGLGRHELPAQARVGPVRVDAVGQVVECHRAVALVQAELEARLGAQALEAAGGHAVGRGLGGREVVDGGDTGGGEPRPLRPVHPADEQHVAALLGGLGAVRAVAQAAAGQVAVVLPAHRAGVGYVGVEHLGEPGAPFAEDGQQVGQPVRGGLSRAEHQVHLVGRVDPRRQELVRVGGELEQGAHLGAARELRVVHGVPEPRAQGVAHQEVGPAVEPPVEERGLVDDVGAPLERGQGARVRVEQLVP